MNNNALFPSLLPTNATKQLVQQWLQEDIPTFDYSGYIVGNKEETGYLLCKQAGVLAGVPFFNAVFEAVGCKVKWFVEEGTVLTPKSSSRKDAIKCAEVTGPASAILQGERTALNVLARASGIAVRCNKASQIAKEKKYNGVLAASRKTTPGFRIVEKYAAKVGGCDSHRMNLSSMIMIKDNAIEACGGITKAVQKAKRAGGFSVKIEVECDTEEEAVEAIKAGADIVMLDNFKPDQIEIVSKSLKQQFPNITIEASGGITTDTCANYMFPTIDVISMGSLIQGVPHVDFSLKLLHDIEAYRNTNK